MRLVFLYTQQGAGVYPIDWNVKTPTQNFFAVEEGGLRSEGYFWLLKQLKATKVFDDILVVIESNRYPGSTHIDGVPCIVIPVIDYLHQFLRPDDVIWVRGGFRSWFVHLERLKRMGHWLLLYAANTGRQRWLIWDVIFDDYRDTFWLDPHKRLWAKFNKPTNPDIFKFTNSEPEYDICVGGSHIHDKKGQWRTINALVQYKHARKRNLRAIMPGRYIKGERTRQIPNIVQSEGLDLVTPGMIPRPQLCKIFNKSKIFVYLGEHGQNDRGPLEAMSCGAKVILASNRCHQPEICKSPFCRVVKNSDYDQITQTFDDLLKLECSRSEIVDYYQKVNGCDSVILPHMRRVFETIKQIPQPDPQELYKRLIHGTH